MADETAAERDLRLAADDAARRIREAIEAEKAAHRAAQERIAQDQAAEQARRGGR
jgi:hypothetical protein